MQITKLIEKVFYCFPQNLTFLETQDPSIDILETLWIQASYPQLKGINFDVQKVSVLRVKGSRITNKRCPDTNKRFHHRVETYEYKGVAGLPYILLKVKIIIFY